VTLEIDVFEHLVAGRLARDPGYTAVQTIPGIGPILGAVLVAEIGDVHRFTSAHKLTCWAGMTPLHRESDTKLRRGRITKQGSRLVRWAATESVQRLPGHTLLGAFRDKVAAKRGHNIAVIAAARRQLEYVYYALRDHHVRANLREPASAAPAATTAATGLAS
jgi:transposase